MVTVERQEINDTWEAFTLSSGEVCVSFLNYGGIITKLVVPDKDGKLENIVLAYENYESYIENPYYLGAIIGRIAGRVKNAEAVVGGQTIILDKNEDLNHLHGGVTGFHNVVWKSNVIEADASVAVELTHESPAGESGYPGNIQVKVTYTLTEDGVFFIDYEARSDEETLLTMTNHSYFNLSGQARNTVHDHTVKMNANQYAELGEDLIAVDVTACKGTFDFQEAQQLGDGLRDGNTQNKLVDGYDHYFLFEEGKEGRIGVADEVSGRTMTVETNQPGVVMYTANGEMELGDASPRKHLGVCFETQVTPATVWLDGLPSITLRPGETYKKQTRFMFGIK